eukprot:TRINITY_DN15415_c0_g2_i2.p1 TRINITY_DN15415_c0_g2~~TRINITY_DN15415_c0_g2_i2.p1  ORF type:complete len:611 (-),score=80.30 TRINITY_DN15415_c0_g2_i2:229-2061(-)
MPSQATSRLSSHNMKFAGTMRSAWVGAGGERSVSFAMTKRDSRRISINVYEMHRMSILQSLSSTSEEEEQESSWWYGISPNSSRAFVWDTLGALLIITDAIMVPLQFAFDMSGMPAYDVLAVLNVFAVLYWQADLVARFLIGYQMKSGIIERYIPAIAKRYFKSWFLLDLSACLMDIVFATMGAGRSSARTWNIMRLNRMLRVLERSPKFFSLSSRWLDRVQSEYVVILTKICYIFAGLLFVGHYAACGWVAVGEHCLLENQSSWLDQRPDVRQGEADTFYVYVLALHLSLAQSGLAAVEVHAACSIEHVYAVGLSWTWWMCIAVTLGNLTVWIMWLTKAEKSTKSARVQLRKFLREQKVSADLNASIMRCFRDTYRSQIMQESEVRFLTMIPESLRVRLHSEARQIALMAHPALQRFSSLVKIGVSSICHLAVEDKAFDSGEEVYLEGTKANEIIFLKSGKAKFYPRATIVPFELNAGGWACEVALWMHWRHTGRLVVQGPAAVTMLSAEKFAVVISEGEKLGWPVDPLRRYAAAVVSRVDLQDPYGDVRSISLEDATRHAQEAFDGWDDQGRVARYFFKMRNSVRGASKEDHLSPSTSAAGSGSSLWG